MLRHQSYWVWLGEFYIPTTTRLDFLLWRAFAIVRKRGSRAAEAADTWEAIDGVIGAISGQPWPS